MATDSATQQYLSVDDILAANDAVEEDVEMPEWGPNGRVRVKGLTKRQQVDIRRAAMVAGEVDPEKVQMGIWQQGVIEPRFPDEALGPLFDKSAGPVDRVLAVILRLSGMEDDSVKKKEATFRPGA